MIWIRQYVWLMCGYVVGRCEEHNVIDFVFFFKQKTAYEIYQCDWSSDVCSSDLKSVFV